MTRPALTSTVIVPALLALAFTACAVTEQATSPEGHRPVPVIQVNGDSTQHKPDDDHR